MRDSSIIAEDLSVSLATLRRSTCSITVVKLASTFSLNAENSIILSKYTFSKSLDMNLVVVSTALRGHCKANDIPENGSLYLSSTDRVLRRSTPNG